MSLEKNKLATARISRSEEGGPVRTILNGRRRGWTGTFVAFKADHRAMPWESRTGELPLLQAAEVASGVSKLLAQPHRLEMRVQELNRSLIYFPDMEISADEEFLADLKRGVPFSIAAATPRSQLTEPSWNRRIVLEMKVEGDTRQYDEYYLEKLRLARSVYERVGINFFQLDRSRDFPDATLANLKSVVDRRHSSINLKDIDGISELFATGSPQPFKRVAGALGGDPLGIAKMATLHIRRMISIDLRKPVSGATDVFKLAAKGCD